MSNITTEIFNQGETLAPLVQPNNKTSFLLTEDECAFVNAINLHTTTLKTVLFDLVSHVEQQMEQQLKIASELKDQFITALAKKHAIAILENDKERSLEIDLSNKLLILSSSEGNSFPL
jgi:hypothetical protein